MARRFQRTVENFSCLVCHHEVIGDGFTNHCPECLWSLHVDNSPGDRAAICHGLMEPIAVGLKGQKRVLTHRCTRCGEERRIGLRPEDNFEAVLAVIRKSLTDPGA